MRHLWFALASLASFHTACSAGTSAGSIALSSPDEAEATSGASALGTITLEVPTSAELCQERHKTLNKIIKWKADKILEYCNEESFGDCALRDQCVKSVLRTVHPHELTFSLSARQYAFSTDSESSFERNFFLANKGSTMTTSQSQGLTIQFNFTWKFGGPASVTRKETCVSPMETAIGENFLKSLLRALDQAHLFHENDPCRKLALQDDVVPSGRDSE